MENQGIDENEKNVPMEMSVASVAAAALAVTPPGPVDAPPKKKKILRMMKSKPGAGAGAAAAPVITPRVNIERMKKDLEEGRQRLKPEELNNPFSKEFNKLLLKKELLEREMTIHDIGVLPGDEGEGDGAAAAAADSLYPTSVSYTHLTLPTILRV